MNPSTIRIGIDVGATKVVVAAVKGAEVLRSRRFELADVPDPASCRKAMAEAVAEVSQGRPIELIGVGCPGPCDFEQGVLLNEITMPRYFGWNLKADLESDTGAPVVMMNDVDAALLGEMVLGSWQTCESVSLLSVGTGVGAAWWSQGRLHVGRGIAHPEISQVPWQNGVLGDILSGAFVKAQAERGNYVDVAAFAAAARAGDPEALVLLEPFCRAAGWAVSVIAHLYCPQVIILSGTALLSLFPLVQPEIQRSLSKAGNVRGETMRVVLSSGGSDATVVGAAGATVESRGGALPLESSGCQIEPCADHGALSRRAADEVIRLVSQKPSALIVCPTGATPVLLYRLLAEHEIQNPEFFSRVRILGLDEWGGLGAELSSSCLTYLKAHVVEPLHIGAGCFFDPAASEPEPECRRIAGWLEKEGPVDLCLLGVGRNGHLGLNEPAETMLPFAHPAVLSPASLAHSMLQGRGGAHLFGMTLGMRDILSSVQILCLWSGEGKTQVFQTFGRHPASARLPVSLLRTHPNALILVDGQG